MAVAVRVTDGDRAPVAWLKIEDDAGAVWTYRQAGAAEPTASPHVVYAPTSAGARTPVLVRDHNKQVVLRQDEPGLPATIVVRLLSSTVPGPGTIGGWGGLFLYQQEAP